MVSLLPGSDTLNIPDYHQVVAKRLLAIEMQREMNNGSEARKQMISLIHFARGIRGGMQPERDEFRHIRTLDAMEFVMGKELALSGLSPTQNATGETLLSQLKDRRRAISRLTDSSAKA